MDYEKLHKETINRLQQMVSCGKITVETACGICADFVPESEDEKIRKEIINYFEHHPNIIVKRERKSDYIAWLEKQGEQKPDDKVVKFNVGDKVYNIKDKFECTIESIDDTTYYCDTTNFDIKDQNNWELVEQKPAEEYSFNVKSELFHQLTKEQQGLWRKEIEQAYNAGANAQKPSEWSKEDESIALGVEQLCNCASLLNIAPDKIDKIRTWLKHLKDRVQPQRESDERNKLLGKLEEWLDEYVSDLADVDTASLIGSFTNYLDGKLPKPIRPQKKWKPSKTEIAELQNAYYGQSYDKVILGALYEQIKKL